MKVTKTVKFEMAHRLVNHCGLCKNVHGHSYVVDITLEGTMSNNGMILDFSNIKQLWEKYQTLFDHSIMLEDCPENELLINTLKTMGMKLNVVKFNPTAENMAIMFKENLQKDLHEIASKNKFDNFIKVCSVRVHETVSSFAEV